MAVRKANWLQKVIGSYRQTLANASPYIRYGMYSNIMVDMVCYIWNIIARAKS